MKCDVILRQMTSLTLKDEMWRRLILLKIIFCHISSRNRRRYFMKNSQRQISSIQSFYMIFEVTWRRLTLTDEIWRNFTSNDVNEFKIWNMTSTNFAKMSHFVIFLKKFKTLKIDISRQIQSLFVERNDFRLNSSWMTRHVKWCHMTSFEHEKNMTNIIRRHSSFVKLRNLTCFFINFHHSTSFNVKFAWRFQ